MFGSIKNLGLSWKVQLAPAFLVASFCDFVDLDGPLHMRDDRSPPMSYEGGYLHAPDVALWG